MNFDQAVWKQLHWKIDGQLISSATEERVLYSSARRVSRDRSLQFQSENATFFMFEK